MEKEMFNELVESIKEAKEIMKGVRKPSRKYIIDEPNPKKIRAKLNLSQSKFANLLNISVHTLRNWEQGRRNPKGPAKVLLNVADKHPEVFDEIIKA